MLSTVLIVDDVLEARMLMSKILRKRGYTTLEASSGREAVDLIKNNRDIALVLLDIMLADMDGYEVLSKVINIKEQRGFKVLFVSGKKEKDGVIKAIRLGGDDYLVKPVFPDMLLAKVTLLLGKKSPSDTYNEVKCAFTAKLIGSTVIPDIHVLELTELTILLRSTAGFRIDSQIEIDSRKLRYYLKNENSYTLMVTKCDRESIGKYLVRCRFVGIPESVTKAIRSLAIKGKLLS